MQFSLEVPPLALLSLQELHDLLLVAGLGEAVDEETGVGHRTVVVKTLSVKSAHLIEILTKFIQNIPADHFVWEAAFGIIHVRPTFAEL